MKRLKWIALGLGVVLIGYPAWLGFQIWQQSHRDEIQRADAIVVLGAAQYDGDPSPVFEARLNHAAYLFNTDVSDTIIVTGGKQRGDRFTESEAGKAYLSDEEEIPESNILEEDEGTTTLESLEAVREMAADEDIETVLFVSDPLHSERIKRMADDLGFEESYASPASYLELDRSRLTKAKELVREIGSLIAYELLDR